MAACQQQAQGYPRKPTGCHTASRRTKTDPPAGLNCGENTEQKTRLTQRWVLHGRGPWEKHGKTMAFDTLHDAQPAQRTAHQIVCDQDRSCGSRMYESEGYCGGMEDRFAQNSEGAYSHTFIPSRFAPDGGGQKKSQRNLYKQPIPITARRASELLRNCSL